MGIRGEIKSYKLSDKEFTYFVNIKEDRYKTIFLSLVLSEKIEESYKRSQIIVYKEDLYDFSLCFEKMFKIYESDKDKKEESSFSIEHETERRIYNFNLKGIVKNNNKSFSLRINEILKFDPDKKNIVLVFERNIEKISKMIKEAFFFIERF